MLEEGTCATYPKCSSHAPDLRSLGDDDNEGDQERSENARLLVPEDRQDHHGANDDMR